MPASSITPMPAVNTSFAFTDRLIEAGVDPSIGSVGDAYDNALAESTIGLFKTELIKRFGPWRDCESVEIETLEWVHWFNTERPTSRSMTSRQRSSSSSTTIQETVSSTPAETQNEASGNTRRFIPWFGDSWQRVATAALEDVDAGRIYVAPGDYATDMMDRSDVEAVAQSRWLSEHVSPHEALAVIRTSRTDIAAAKPESTGGLGVGCGI